MEEPQTTVDIHAAVYDNVAGKATIIASAMIYKDQDLVPGSSSFILSSGFARLGCNGKIFRSRAFFFPSIFV